MFPYWQKAILISLVLAISVPTSTADRRGSRRDLNSGDREKYLRDLCSGTQNPDACWKNLKSPLQRLENSSDKDIAKGVLDLARAKSKEIRDKLNQWYKASNDENLKKKYHFCSIKYNEVERRLGKALEDLSTNDRRKGWYEIDDSQYDVDVCMRQFGRDSSDPGHVGNREFEVYLDVVRAAAERLEGYNRPDYARNLH